MSQAVSNDAVQRVLNLSIQKKLANPIENRKDTAIELFSRASALEEAIRTLSYDYTYEITTSDPKRIAARKQLGGMSREVLIAMRDELYSAGAQEWRAYETLSNNRSGSDSSTQVSAQTSES
jgi:hypothetical protein